MVGVVIVNYRSWELTVRCVLSIRENVKCEYHIYVVENGSPGDSLSRLHEKFDGCDDVTIVQSDHNGGYGYGLNLGARAAIAEGCKELVLSNNDIVYYPESIERMLGTLRRHADVGVVCAQQVGLDAEQMQSVSVQEDTPWRFALLYTPLGEVINVSFSRKAMRTTRRNLREIQVSYPNGGCYMASSAALSSAGFFDERMFLYCEENVLGFRLRSLGYRILFNPCAVVLHAHSQTTGNDPALRLIRSLPSVWIYGNEYLGWNGLQRWVFKFGSRIYIETKILMKMSYRKRAAELRKSLSSLGGISG